MKIRAGLVLLTFVGLAFPVAANPPAAIAPHSTSPADLNFDDFAKDWMKKLHDLERKSRGAPGRSKTGSSVSYRGYSSEFSTELKPTGRPEIPYVGILQYSERVYRCTDATLERCSIASVVPVTEIFRFQNGRWVY